jgi:hypothetical protein
MYIGGTIYEPQTIDRVIFLSSDDIFVEFKDSYTFNFSKYSKSGSTDLNDGIYSGTSNKLKISLNIVYQWINADYAPRYNLEVVKNNVVDKRRSLGINDTYLDENIINERFVINVQSGNKIEIRISKDNEASNFMRIEGNAYLEFEAF